MTIKEAFQQLANATKKGMKNPFFIMRSLNKNFSEIADKIEGGGGGSSEVDYSTEEKKLGKWIDGTNYYGRVIELNNLSVSPNQWNSTGVSASGIKQILKGSLIDTQSPAQAFVCNTGVDNNLINVMGLFPGSSARTMKYLIIQYTKNAV